MIRGEGWAAFGRLTVLLIILHPKSIGLLWISKMFGRKNGLIETMPRGATGEDRAMLTVRVSFRRNSVFCKCKPHTRSAGTKTPCCCICEFFSC